MKAATRQKGISETAEGVAEALELLKRKAHESAEPPARVSLKLRIDSELHEKLRNMAHARRMSINSICTEIFVKYMSSN